MSRAPVDPERRTQRRLVEEADRRYGATELDASGDCRAQELRARPELAPAGLGEAVRELVVAIVLPRAEIRLAWRLPAGERTTQRLREEGELGGYVEGHPSSLRTASVCSPSDGAGAGDRKASPIRTNGASSRTAPSPGCSISPTSRSART